MIDEKKLGVFWGNGRLCLVETFGTNPTKIVHIPFDENTEGTEDKNMLGSWGSRLASTIRSTLEDQAITTSTINLSLPTKDIIFRSFIIPWMQQHEIKNVVEFEISKYIPFSLENLSFTFHPITITENDRKLIRIIFVAIKSDVLASYVQILHAASLHANIVEPATSSLIRSLGFKNLIPKNQTVALVEKENFGRIIIIDDNIPQFVREFDLSTAPTEQDGSGEKELSKEVRISLNYFNRQNEHLNVKKILYLTASGNEDVAQNLAKSLDMPVAAIAGNSVLDNASEGGVDTLSAYGASIASSLKSSASFNLCQQKSEIAKHARTFNREPINAKSLLKTASVCVPLMLVSIAMSILPAQTIKNKIATLNQKLSSYQNVDISFIERKETMLKIKLNYFQNTRVQSDAALFLLLIPEILPKGVWLQGLDIAYDDSKMFDENKASRKKRRGTKDDTGAGTTPLLAVTLDGYTYSKNKSEQFRLVNKLLGRLKESVEFSKFFQNIYLETISAENLNEHDVTYFKVICKQSHEDNRPQ